MRKKKWAQEASSASAMRARLDLLAFERGIARSETRAVMKNGKAMIDFSRRHRVSLDWLIRGDLAGLLRTVQWAASSR